MKKQYVKPEAEKVEFDYSENVTASTYGPWELTNVTNPGYPVCDSSYKDSFPVCGYNGKNISNPNYECNN